MTEPLYRSRITGILDQRGIDYRVLPHGGPVYTVEEAARQRDVVTEEMVKCILLCDTRGRYVMACVRGDMRVDHRAVRRALGDDWRRLHFASAEEIQSVTGCVKGAVSPIGLPDDLPLLFDRLIADCPKVNISSGDPVFGLELGTQPLIDASGASLALIAE